MVDEVGETGLGDDVRPGSAMASSLMGASTVGGLAELLDEEEQQQQEGQQCVYRDAEGGGLEGGVSEEQGVGGSVETGGVDGGVGTGGGVRGHGGGGHVSFSGGGEAFSSGVGREGGVQGEDLQGWVDVVGEEQGVQGAGVDLPQPQQQQQQQQQDGGPESGEVKLCEG